MPAGLGARNAGGCEAEVPLDSAVSRKPWGLKTNCPGTYTVFGCQAQGPLLSQVMEASAVVAPVVSFQLGAVAPEAPPLCTCWMVPLLSITTALAENCVFGAHVGLPRSLHCNPSAVVWP